MPTTDLYEALGVPRNSSAEDIKKAYRKQAMRYHPDKANASVDETTKQKNEEKFKELSNAYSVLSDPEKKHMYDTTGMVDNVSQPSHTNLNEMFSEMFGHTGHPGMEFFAGMPGGGQGHSFKMFFGNQGRQETNGNQDVIEVPVSMTEIYKGITKTISYEVLDRCDTCFGTGAKSPSDVVRCMTCQGSGSIPQQMGPFMIQQGCPSCGGRGQMIKQNKECLFCKGKRAMYYTRSFDLRIPQGVPNKHMHRMDGKGSFDVQSGRHSDLVLMFVHQIDEQFKVDYGNNSVHLEVDIKLDELLCGFIKQFEIYDEIITLHSNSYFNPSKPFIVEKKGLPVFKKKEFGNLHIHFNMIYPDDDEKFSKYHTIFMSMFKKKQLTVPSNAIEIH